MLNRAGAGTTIYRIVKFGLVSFWRNRLLSLAATLVMTLTLITISVFIILLLVINTMVGAINEKIDLAVYFHDSASEQEISGIVDEVKKFPEVTKVEYIDKNEALRRWQAREIDPRLKEAVTEEENALPRSLEIKVDNPDHIAGVAKFFERNDIKPLVRKTSDKENKVVIERLSNITKFVRKTGFIFSGVFILISILIVFNTIRLAIFTRKDEIEIMKLVGANRSFIRWPFILEGVLHGFFATLLSVLLLYLGFRMLSPMISKYLGEVLKGNLISYFNEHLLAIIFLQLAVGILIGVGCSMVAIRKYLNA